ncbi:barstar family protein [Actinomadura alba]|nr:barstar family protein [Actinomadura alba]
MSELGGIEMLLTGAAKPGVYRWTVPGATRRGDVADAAARAGRRLFWLAGQSVTDGDEFLDLCAESFAFPDWFGHDWDALGDCLTDLTWADADAGFLVVYAGWQALAQEDPGAFGTAVEIFESAVDLWRDTVTPMTVLLPGDGDDPVAAGLPLLGA